MVAVEGKYGNVVYLMPPMCFSRENADTFIKGLEKLLEELSSEELDIKVRTHQKRAPTHKYTYKYLLYFNIFILYYLVNITLSSRLLE